MILDIWKLAISIAVTAQRLLSVNIFLEANI